MLVTLHINNLRAIRKLCWSPAQVSCLVGPNGSGKTTVLLVLKLLRAALDGGLSRAVGWVLGGSHKLKNNTATEEEPVEIGLTLGDVSWRLLLMTEGASISPFAGEEVTISGEVVLSRTPQSRDFTYRGETIPGDERLA